MTSLPDLIARVEKASGAAPELHAEIALAFGWFAPLRDGVCGQNYIYRADYEWRDDKGERRGFDPPYFTASLDAAMSLVPEGYEFALGTGRQNAMSEEHKSPWARVFALDDISAPPSLAATPALALLAAALRARNCK